MTITMSKEERLNLRTTAETKQLLQRAAEVKGVSISEFILGPALLFLDRRRIRSVCRGGLRP